MGGHGGAPERVSTTRHQRQAPRILQRPEHPISRRLISENALRVLYRLHRAGFLAYLVGGAVRDCLLGGMPKDFDVATNARPQQVRQLFRNARLVGRRFRLARLLFSQEVVEVATFRRAPEPAEETDGEAADVLAPAVEAEEFGSPEEDAWRRDFTVNGLFYNIADFSVIDYVGGLEDLSTGVLRTIGPPRERINEDPVRMMRAVEYSARLGFEMDPDLEEAIFDLRLEIRRAAPARIAYELSESLAGGHAAAILQGLEEFGLLPEILPEAQAASEGPRSGLLWDLLEAADRRNRNGKAVSSETMLGILFLPGYLARFDGMGEEKVSFSEMERCAREILDPAVLRLSLSHHQSHLLRYGFLFLMRLFETPRSPRLALRTVSHECFPVAWDLATLLAEVKARPEPALQAWQLARERVQAGLPPLEERHDSGKGSSKRRRRRRKPRPADGVGTANGNASS